MVPALDCCSSFRARWFAHTTSAASRRLPARPNARCASDSRLDTSAPAATRRLLVETLPLMDRAPRICRRSTRAGSIPTPPDSSVRRSGWPRQRVGGAALRFPVSHAFREGQESLAARNRGDVRRNVERAVVQGHDISCPYGCLIHASIHLLQAAAV